MCVIFMMEYCMSVVNQILYRLDLLACAYFEWSSVYAWNMEYVK